MAEHLWNISKKSDPLQHEYLACGALSRWRTWGWLLPGDLATRLCILSIEAMWPGADLYAADAVASAQLQLERATARIRFMRGGTPGDAQAIKAYQTGLAAGFYERDPRDVPLPDIPMANSPWQRCRLVELQMIGLGHGASYHRLAPRKNRDA